MRDKGNLRTRGPHGLDSIVVGYYQGKGWGEGMTADEMKKCVWVRPTLVAQIEFLGVDRRRPFEAFKVCRLAGR